MMRILIANDKFKGSLTAAEAAEAMGRGLLGSVEVDVCPIADGGEGFTETMLAAVGGEMVSCEVVDALMRPRVGRYGVTSTGLAVMEMASACGFEHLAEGDRDVLRSSTYGTGLLIRHAAGRAGVERILIGIGGSATNDAGVGMADALGVMFLDAEDEPIGSFPSELWKLAAVDGAQLVKLPPIEVACDVDNPLLGVRGATAIFGPQKGAGEAEREVLEAALGHLVEVMGAHELAEVPGAGAAGGLGFGLMAFCGAKLHGGFDLVAEALDLEGRIAAADLVITGEGALDGQSLSGKGPVGVARLARKMGKPVMAVAGMITDEVRMSGLFDHCGALTDFGFPLEVLMRDAGPLLTKKVAEISGLLESLRNA